MGRDRRRSDVLLVGKALPNLQQRDVRAESLRFREGRVQQSLRHGARSSYPVIFAR